MHTDACPGSSCPHTHTPCRSLACLRTASSVVSSILEEENQLSSDCICTLTGLFDLLVGSTQFTPATLGLYGVDGLFKIPRCTAANSVLGCFTSRYLNFFLSCCKGKRKSKARGQVDATGVGFDRRASNCHSTLALSAAEAVGEVVHPVHVFTIRTRLTSAPLTHSMTLVHEPETWTA